MDEGDGQVPPALPVPHRGRRADRAAGPALLLAHARRRSSEASRRTAPTASRSSPSRRRPARNLDEAWLQPITGGASKINIFGAIEGSFVYRVNALTGDPNHLGIEVAAAILLAPARSTSGSSAAIDCACRSPLLLAFLTIVDLATLSRSGLLGLGCGFLVLAVPYRRMLLQPQFLVPLGLLLAGLAVIVARRANFFEQVLSSRLSTEGRGATPTSSSTRSSPTCSRRTRSSASASTPSRSTTSSRRARRTSGRTRSTSPRSSSTASSGRFSSPRSSSTSSAAPALTRRIGRALAAAGDPLAARIRPLGWGLAAALVSDDGLEPLLPDDVLLLLLRARAARDRGAGRARAPPRRARVKVVVLTTSYPRDADDVAGTFVRDGVEALRAAGVEVRVVSPATFRHYGIAYGDGIVNNLRRAPWKLLALPLFLARSRARRAGRPRRRRRPRPLAAERPAGARHGQADRAPALGLGRRPRAARAPARAVAAAARTDRRLRLDGARRRRPRARRARRRA